MKGSTLSFWLRHLSHSRDVRGGFGTTLVFCSMNIARWCFSQFKTGVTGVTTGVPAISGYPPLDN